MARGVMYVAYGRKAHDEAAASIASLRRFHDWPVLVVGDAPIKGAEFKRFADTGTPGRWAKVNLNKLSDWEHTLFLDADTRVNGCLDVGFRLLDCGYALVMVPSAPQHNEALRHIDDRERAATLAVLPLDPLQLNTGVMWFSHQADALFEAWRVEWARFKDKDQGALLRALYKHPVPVALLGAPFNALHGEVVDHRFGKAA